MRFKWLVIIIFVMWASPCIAATIDWRAFDTLPIQSEGRVKPLDHFAQLLLRDISGHDTYKKMPSDAWLAAVMFTPSWAEEEKFFTIPNRAVIQALDITPDDEHRYSFATLNAAFIKNAQLLQTIQQQQDPTADQQTLLQLFIKVTVFEQVKDSMTLVLPLNDAMTTKQKLWAKDMLLAKGKQNEMLRIVPVANSTDLQSLWQHFVRSPNDAAVFDLWRNAAQAYVNNDADAFNMATTQLLYHALDHSVDQTLRWRLPLENIYHRAHLYFCSMVLYALALLGFLWRRYRTAAIAMGGGIVLHGLALVLRMAILLRPPVSTLYESLAFVGFMTVLLAAGLAWRGKRPILLALAALLGIILHAVGFSLQDAQDNLKVLQAVLDTRFWLATHVIIITVGYALCLLTSLCAQAALWQNNARLIAWAKIMGLWSLAFVTTGTILGGVWADQSWGRFWGWDPKENGALLIVLWLVWLLHGLVAKQITVRGLLLGYGGLSILIAWSWIGTNLLGVGLHSYGFTSGLAGGLACFIVLQCGILYGLWLRTRGQHAKTI